jgi:hypothetical protein
MPNAKWRIVTFARLLIVGALLAVPVSTGAQQPHATFLGVVDEQGRLTPIAVYDGTTWWNRWPWAAESEEVRKLPLPPSLAAIPADWLPPGARLPVTWRAFTSGKLVPFRALRPTRRQDFALMDTVLIRTTYRGPSYVEDTLAISGPGTLASFVDLSNAQADGILRQLESRISILEADAIARWKKEAAARGEQDVALARTYLVSHPSDIRFVNTPPPGDRDYGLFKGRTPIDGRTHLYLSGGKFFEGRPGEPCKLSLSTEGFIAVNPAGHVESERIASGLTEFLCGNPSEAVYYLASVTIGRRSWWVVKIGMEDGEEYGLIDPRTGEPVEIRGLWDLRSNDRKR